MTEQAKARAGRYAVAILTVLTVINFLNYLDRYVLSAVLEPVRIEMGLGDADAGLLGTAFMVVYTVMAPAGGYLGDRLPRKWIVAVSVALWSLATIGSGLAPGYHSMLAMRALVGIGEAGYAAAAPAMIADLFRPARRGRMLAYFYLAIPMGSALGYLLGGYVGQHYGWRAAFWVAGIPGLVFAVAAALMPEPKRGAMDELEDGDAPRLGVVATFRRVTQSRSWRENTVGLTLMTFSMGGIAFWMPTFLVRVHDLELATANTLFGGVTVVAGLVGTLVGGYLGDRAYARSAGGYFSVSGIGLLMGAPLAVALPFIPDTTAVFVVAFGAELLLFLNTGPLNAALVACVPPGLRASAVALNVLFIHALGDAVSPYLLGAISQWRDLATAIALTGGPIAVGGWVLLRAARRVGRDPQGLSS